MRVLVVVDSPLGNTLKIGGQVAEGLAPHDVQLADVLDSPLPDPDLDLLVVGGPTLRDLPEPDRELLRRSERELLLPDSVEPVLAKWIESLPEVDRAPAAAFDTRMDQARLLTGAAGHGIARRLRGRGYRMVAAPESFVVLGASPGADGGEPERARAWGEELSGVLTAMTADQGVAGR